MEPGVIADDRLAELADMFHLMGDPTRLSVLLACLDQARAVSDLAAATGASASLVSHHLRLLRAARIVRAERRGRQIFYCAADAHIRDMLAQMVEHVGERPRSEKAAPETAVVARRARGRAARGLA